MEMLTWGMIRIHVELEVKDSVKVLQGGLVREPENSADWYLIPELGYNFPMCLECWAPMDFS